MKYLLIATPRYVTTIYELDSIKSVNEVLATIDKDHARVFGVVGEEIKEIKLKSQSPLVMEEDESI